MTKEDTNEEANGEHVKLIGPQRQADWNNMFTICQISTLFIK